MDECPHTDAETDDECDQADDPDGRPGQAAARDDDREEAAEGDDAEQYRHTDDALHDVTSWAWVGVEWVCRCACR